MRTYSVLGLYAPSPAISSIALKYHRGRAGRGRIASCAHETYRDLENRHRSPARPLDKFLAVSQHNNVARVWIDAEKGHPIVVGIRNEGKIPWGAEISIDSVQSMNNGVLRSGDVIDEFVCLLACMLLC